MKNIKVLAAATLLLTAAGAYAGTDDGNVRDEAVNAQTVTVQAPAPAAAAAADKQIIDSGIVSPNP